MAFQVIGNRRGRTPLTCAAHKASAPSSGGGIGLGDLWFSGLSDKELDSLLDSLELSQPFQELLKTEEREIHCPRTKEWGTPTDFKLLEIEPREVDHLIELVRNTDRFRSRYPRKLSSNMRRIFGP